MEINTRLNILHTVRRTACKTLFQTRNLEFNYYDVIEITAYERKFNYHERHINNINSINSRLSEDRNGINKI